MDPTQRALFRNIIQNPRDDIPRLVYADWLEEHEAIVACIRCDGCRKRCAWCKGAGWGSNGYKVRAEFIRLQCEIEVQLNKLRRHKKYDGEMFRISDGVRSLVKRETAMLKLIKVENWDVQSYHSNTRRNRRLNIPAIMRRKPEVLMMERGFPDTVWCDSEYWLKHGYELCQTEVIETINLTDVSRFAVMGKFTLNTSDAEDYRTNPLPEKLYQFQLSRGIKYPRKFKDSLKLDNHVREACIAWVKAEHQASVGAL